jgi:hypothetical protein
MFLFCGGFFVSSKSTLVAKSLVFGFICCVQLSSFFFFNGFWLFLFYSIFCRVLLLRFRSIVVLSWQ